MAEEIADSRVMWDEKEILEVLEWFRDNRPGAGMTKRTIRLVKKNGVSGLSEWHQDRIEKAVQEYNRETGESVEKVRKVHAEKAENDPKKKSVQEKAELRETRDRDTKYCSNCGELIDKAAEICPECGVRVAEPRDKKSPGLAAILSFFVPGLGQIYNGQIGKGLLIMAWMFFLFLLILSVPLFSFAFMFITWLLSIYDGHTQATRHNKGEELDF